MGSQGPSSGPPCCAWLNSERETFVCPPLPTWQVDEWSEELVVIETNAKKNSKALLFVISHESRAIASMIETVEYLTGSRSQQLFLVIEEGVPLDYRTSDAELLLRRVEEYGTLRKPTHSVSSFSLLAKKRGTLDAIDDESAAVCVHEEHVAVLRMRIAELESALSESQGREARLAQQNAALRTKIEAVAAALRATGSGPEPGGDSNKGSGTNATVPPIGLRGNVII